MVNKYLLVAKLIIRNYQIALLKITGMTLFFGVVSSIALIALCIIFDLLNSRAPQILPLFSGIFIYATYTFPRVKEEGETVQRLLKMVKEGMEKEALKDV